MSNEKPEQISALVDDELEHGSRFVVNAINSNPTYRALWGRYHLIGECMRGHLPACIDMHLADRISKALQNEPGALITPPLSRLVKPAAGLAIAASVAAVTLLGVRLIGSNPASGTATPAIASSQTGTSGEYQTVRVTAGTTPEQPVQNYIVPDDAQSRLNRYLVNYNEYRAYSGVQGTLPYVRIVAHEVGE